MGAGSRHRVYIYICGSSDVYHVTSELKYDEKISVPFCFGTFVSNSILNIFKDFKNIIKNICCIKTHDNSEIWMTLSYSKKHI